VPAKGVLQIISNAANPIGGVLGKGHPCNLSLEQSHDMKLDAFGGATVDLAEADG
jgi:hypothetical protein